MINSDVCIFGRTVYKTMSGIRSDCLKVILDNCNTLAISGRSVIWQAVQKLVSKRRISSKSTDAFKASGACCCSCSPRVLRSTAMVKAKTVHRLVHAAHDVMKANGVPACMRTAAMPMVRPMNANNMRASFFAKGLSTGKGWCLS